MAEALLLGGGGQAATPSEATGGRSQRGQRWAAGPRGSRCSPSPSCVTTPAPPDSQSPPPLREALEGSCGHGKALSCPCFMDSGWRRGPSDPTPPREGVARRHSPQTAPCAPQPLPHATSEPVLAAGPMPPASRPRAARPPSRPAPQPAQDEGAPAPAPSGSRWLRAPTCLLSPQHQDMALLPAGESAEAAHSADTCSLPLPGHARPTGSQCGSRHGAGGGPPVSTQPACSPALAEAREVTPREVAAGPPRLLPWPRWALSGSGLWPRVQPGALADMPQPPLSPSCGAG